MARKSQGRGAIAAIGLLVLFAGLVGGVVLWYLATTEPNRAAEGFARGAPGCTTTLSFSETGEFYVYEELFGVIDDVEGCQPTATPGRGFTFELNDPDGDAVERVADDSISYDLDVGQATSVARITIDAPGDYELSVLGDDPAVVAAVGGDPEANVDQLRQGAIAAAVAGVVLGALLLWASGRRSRKAATYASPADPGWGVTERDRARRAARVARDDAQALDDAQWPPRPPELQVPVNPHAPDERRVAQLGTDAPGPGSADSPWAPPSADAVAQPVPEPTVSLPPPAAAPAANGEAGGDGANVPGDVEKSESVTETNVPGGDAANVPGDIDENESVTETTEADGDAANVPGDVDENESVTETTEAGGVAASVPGGDVASVPGDVDENESVTGTTEADGDAASVPGDVDENESVTETTEAGDDRPPTA